MDLRQEANENLSRAKTAESNGNHREAIFFYSEAIDDLQSLLEKCEQSNDTAGVSTLRNEIEQWLTVAESVKAKLNDTDSTASFEMQSKMLSEGAQELEMGKFLFERAMIADEDNSIEEAIDTYIQAVEIFMRQGQNANTSPETQQKCKLFAKRGIERAEELKTKLAAGSVAVAGGSGGESFSKEEIKVLYQTSILNGVKCYPFLPIDIREERFAFPSLFTDNELPRGVLSLSEKQAARLHRWVRISELSDQPQILGTLSPNAVKQTIVSDCSFVASLTVAAQCERKHKKALISPHIFPKDRRTGKPVYNPCGKYMIKLHLNGIWRKVIIDDKLPVSRHGRLLCSFSENPNEFWVSLLEKAYLKVMGGYDFPGSNSSIDLNALTGWIPERIGMHSSSQPFNRDTEFDRMFTRFHRGDCLVTVATGEFGDAQEQQTGLAPCHAYAVLDIRKIDGLQLMMIKNPWSNGGWKGKFSGNDEKSWTPSLKAKLGYDPRNARLLDNGIFWMEYTAVCHFFDVFYLSWNPDMFPYRDILHKTWLAGDGPKKDVYDVSGNPQFKLVVKSNQKAVVWVVLTRHITNRDDFAYNHEYITLIVYKNGGRRVYSPTEPFIDGIRINSPHYLAKVNHDGNDNVYTLLVSQFEKSNTLHFTLNAYASCPIEMTEIVDPYRNEYTKTITGEWNRQTAGGCGNNRETYKNNPVFLLSVSKCSEMAIIVKGPRQFSVGFDLCKQRNNDPFWSLPIFETGGPYRSGFLAKEFSKFEPGPYLLVPTTFLPNQEGPFILEIKSSAPFSIKPLKN